MVVFVCVCGGREGGGVPCPGCFVKILGQCHPLPREYQVISDRKFNKIYHRPPLEGTQGGRQGGLFKKYIRRMN